MKPLRVLLFDVFGTVVDWRSSLIEIAEATVAGSGPQAGWPAVIDDWRLAYQPAMDTVRDGAPWRDLDSLQRETLTAVTARHGIVLSESDREMLVHSWRRLAPWPDSKEGLDLLRRHHLTATLSNGHVALLADLLKFGDLRFDALLSAQLAEGYKPDPKVYLGALRLLECPPEEAGMVAAHGMDLQAAAALGLNPLFIRRPDEWGRDAPPEEPPDLANLLVADDLVDLARILER
jgi:2-haloacid dehalogenase